MGHGDRGDLQRHGWRTRRLRRRPQLAPIAADLSGVIPSRTVPMMLAIVAVALSIAGLWGSVAAYVLVAGTAGVLSIRIPEKHSRAIGVACFIFVIAHIARAVFGPASYDVALGFAYIFIAYAMFQTFRRSSGQRPQLSVALEVGAIGAAVLTVLLFNPYLQVPTANLATVALASTAALFALMSNLGRRAAPLSNRYLAAIVLAVWMEVIAQFFPEELFSALFTVPYYPLISGLLLAEADRTLAPTHVAARRPFGLPQVVLFAGTLLASVMVAALSGAMPVGWAVLGAMTTALIFTRISLLIRQRDWSFSQERELRQYGENLISLTSIEEINEATVGTLSRLSGDGGAVAIVEVDRAGRYAIGAEVGTAGAGRRRGKHVEVGVTDPVRAWFPDSGWVGTSVAVQVPDIDGAEATTRFFLCATADHLNPDVEGHLQAAASQYALAARAQELVAAFHEQTVAYAAEQARREAEEAWEALSIGSQEVALRVDDGTVTAVTPHAEEILGLQPMGRDRDDLQFLAPANLERTSFENPERPDQWLRLSVEVVADGTEVFTIRDITADVAAATTDPITGFAAQSTLEALDDDGQPVPGRALHLIDFTSIDRLREQHGKGLAEQALRILAARTTKTFRAREDHFWRGDRNRVLIASSALVSDEHLERRRQELASPFTIGDHEIETEVHIATIAVDPAHGVLGNLQRLQVALNHGLSSNNFVVRYSDDLYATVKRRWDLEQAFKRASADPGHSGFSVHYQPLVSALPTARPVAVEALARWTHPDFGPVSPGEFIPIAEDMGMVDAIDTFVLNQALQDIEVFRRLDPDFLVHVNLSPAKSLAEKFRATRNTLVLHGTDRATSLVVEVTESALGGNDDHDELIHAARKLRDIGVGIAVDDFGTGESNYHRIDALPFTEVKLAGTISSATDPVFLASIVNSFHGLDLEVVAENVEDLDQLTRLRDAGVDIIQGFYYHRPAEIDTIVAWIREQFAKAETPPLAAPYQSDTEMF